MGSRCHRGMEGRHAISNLRRDFFAVGSEELNALDEFRMILDRQGQKEGGAIWNCAQALDGQQNRSKVDFRADLQNEGKSHR
jgi:hypothetical protein